jgi:cyclase
MGRRGWVAIILLTAGLSIATVEAQLSPKPGPVPIPALQKVRDNLYVLGGGDPRVSKEFSGGNTGIFITERGVVLVDTKFAGWGQVILDKVKSVTDKPVTTIINTHTHFDHAGSNTEFPASVNFVAHENTKTYMQQTKCPPVTTCLTGANAQYLPKQTFKDTSTMFSGKDQIDLYYFGAGHTNGDIFVVFRALGVVQTGDLFQVKWLPFIDEINGGSAVAFPDTLKKAIAGIKGVDTVITGHGAVMTWQDLVDHEAILRDFVEKGRAGKKAGQMPAQLAASYKIPAKFANAGYDIVQDSAKTNFEMVYRQLP